MSSERIWELFQKAVYLKQTLQHFDHIDFGEDDPDEINKILEEKKRSLRVCLMVLQVQCKNQDSQQTEEPLIPTWDLVMKDLG